jgi:hypothetical protein
MSALRLDLLRHTGHLFGFGGLALDFVAELFGSIDCLVVAGLRGVFGVLRGGLGAFHGGIGGLGGSVGSLVIRLLGAAGGLVADRAGGVTGVLGGILGGGAGVLRVLADGLSEGGYGAERNCRRENESGESATLHRYLLEGQRECPQGVYAGWMRKGRTG